MPIMTFHLLTPIPIAARQIPPQRLDRPLLCLRQLTNTMIEFAVLVVALTKHDQRCAEVLAILLGLGFYGEEVFLLEF